MTANSRPRIKGIVALLLILVLAAFLRFYRLSELAKFNYDEARDATEEYQIIRRHLTLLGPDSKIGDRILYFGPLHYYLMAPALLATEFNPLGTYYWTAFLGVVTTFLIYFLTKNFFSVFFYAAFPVAVIFNRWAWNPNTVPLFTTLFLIFLVRKKYFLAGIFLGLAVQLHFTAGLLIFFAFLARRQWINAVTLFWGLIVGLSPIIVFDFRHNFLYLHSVLGLFGANWAYRGFAWHYFLWALPILAWGMRFLPRRVALVVITVSFLGAVYWLGTVKPVLAQNPGTIKKIANIIANDTRSSVLPFDVASFVDPDARATAYRYFLMLDGVKPSGVGEYGVVDHLYVITFESANKVLYNQTYEISALKPKRISKSWKIKGENIYRLERN